MNGGLQAAERGCLVLADFSRYTEYLLASELEHANDVIADLTGVVVRGLEPVLKVAKLEGDAVFAYVLEGSYAPSTLLDAVEQAYFAFRSRLRDISHATTCTCQACALMPTLDLKFLVHEGSFVRRKVGRAEELTGRDVILVHRLLKNGAAEAIGSRGYALLTEACVQVLGLDPEALGLLLHTESYDDVGEVRCYLENLDERWRYEQERKRVYVTAKEAVFERGGELPVEPAVAWEWLTSPERRTEWGGGRIEPQTAGGRSRVGVMNHCIHGSDVIVEHVADWRPFRYYTMRYEIGGLVPMHWTTELEPVEGGTRVLVRGALVGKRAREKWELVREQLDHHVDESAAAMGRLAERLSLEGGTDGSAAPALVPTEET